MNFRGKLTLFIFTVVLLSSCSNKNKQLIYADASTVWWLAPTIIAQEQGLYEKNNLKIKTFDVRTGLDSKNAVLSGSADVGMVAATPLAIGAYDKEDIIVLASFVESDSLIAILTKDSVISEPIALVQGTISQFYFYKYMQKHDSTFNLENAKKLFMKPPAITNTLNNNDANTVTIWEPFASNYDKKGLNVIEIREGNLYTLKLFLITRPDVLKNKRSEVEKFVKCIHDACIYINNNDKQVREKLEEHFNQIIPANIWNSVQFEVKLGKENYQIMKENIYDDAILTYRTGIKSKELDKSSLDYLFDQDFTITK